MVTPPPTRTEALVKAAEWAKSAHRCYARSAQARDDAQRLVAAGTSMFAPEVERLMTRSAVDAADCETETKLATAWAAIADAAHDETHVVLEVTEP
ncbi:hypothetical protein ACFWOG_04455 [Kitasatospora sp. NPDC058406]|uniref:hypothetical protein n=1 Tax=Kitasatospora sp. NPDC058406 TaxID=3346483 RepID=UPI00365B5DB0